MRSHKRWSNSSAYWYKENCSLKIPPSSEGFLPLVKDQSQEALINRLCYVTLYYFCYTIALVKFYSYFLGEKPLLKGDNSDALSKRLYSLTGLIVYNPQSSILEYKARKNGGRQTH